MTTASVMSRLRGAAAPEGLSIGDDFPLLCENCLGDSKFVRMMKLPSYSACKITNRPFNVFRWRPGRGLAYKETIVCYEIAAEKNICQACLNDIDYNVPLALRDAFEASLGGQDSLAPKSEVNQAYHFNQQLALRSTLENTASVDPAYRMLELAKRAENGSVSSEIRLPSLCLGWVKGSCPRGAECGFRPCCGAYVFPELNEGDSSRLIGLLEKRGPRGVSNLDKPVFDTLLNACREAIRVRKENQLRPPDDQTVKTLYVAGVDDSISNEDLKREMGNFGAAIRVQRAGATRAFVEFKSRQGAEAASNQLQGTLLLNGLRLKVGWAAKKTPGKKAPRSEDPEEVEIAKKKTSKYGEVSQGLIRAPSKLPEIWGNIPLPAGMTAANEPMAPPPVGLVLGNKPPAAKKTKKDSVCCFKDIYPSLQPGALDGTMVFI